MILGAEWCPTGSLGGDFDIANGPSGVLNSGTAVAPKQVVEVSEEAQLGPLLSATKNKWLQETYRLYYDKTLTRELSFLDVM